MQIRLQYVSHSRRMPHRDLSSLPFTSLAGGDAASLAGTDLCAAQTSNPSAYSTALMRETPSSSVTVAMLVGALSHATATSSHDLLLEAATKTWMRSTSIEELMRLILFMDCGHQPEEPAEPKGASATTLPLWLRSQSLQPTAYCYHGRAQGADFAPYMYSKTAAMLRLLHALPSTRFYLKLDSDTLLVPSNLLRFVQFLGAHVLPTSPRLYFGSSVFRLHRPDSFSTLSKQWTNHHQLYTHSV